MIGNREWRDTDVPEERDQRDRGTASAGKQWLDVRDVAAEMRERGDVQVGDYNKPHPEADEEEGEEKVILRPADLQEAKRFVNQMYYNEEPPAAGYNDMIFTNVMWLVGLAPEDREQIHKLAGWCKLYHKTHKVPRDVCEEEVALIIKKKKKQYQ